MKKTYHSLISVMKTLHLSTDEALCLISCGQMNPTINVENLRTRAIQLSGGTTTAGYMTGLFQLTPLQCSRIFRSGSYTLFYLPAKANTVITLPRPLTVQLSDLIITNDDYEWIATFYPAPEDPKQKPSSEPHEAYTSSMPNAISESLRTRL